VRQTGQKADLAQPRKDSGSAPKKLRQKNSNLSVRWILDSINGALGPDPESATPRNKAKQSCRLAMRPQFHHQGHPPTLMTTANLRLSF
jgi:hypothetical protein